MLGLTRIYNYYIKHMNIYNCRTISKKNFFSLKESFFFLILLFNIIAIHSSIVLLSMKGKMSKDIILVLYESLYH